MKKHSKEEDSNEEHSKEAQRSKAKQHMEEE
jgi:hypothetical protein